MTIKLQDNMPLAGTITGVNFAPPGPQYANSPGQLALQGLWEVGPQPANDRVYINLACEGELQRNGIIGNRQQNGSYPLLVASPRISLLRTSPDGRRKYTAVNILSQGAPMQQGYGQPQQVYQQPAQQNGYAQQPYQQPQQKPYQGGYNPGPVQQQPPYNPGPAPQAPPELSKKQRWEEITLTFEACLDYAKRFLKDETASVPVLMVTNMLLTNSATRGAWRSPVANTTQQQAPPQQQTPLYGDGGAPDTHF